MFLGVRVVRGPDWKWNDQDGGIGCVGTVVPAQDKNSVTGVWVRWDSGQAANYRAGGSSGKYDLRIYDNAQLGVKHRNIVCDGCQENGIEGMRWKCLECHDFDLCHSCYNEGKHSLGHRFTRIESNSVPGIEVPCRFGAIKHRAWGIFPGARVVRGPDWEWKDQDGGEGKVGTVAKVSGGGGTYHSWIAVRWPNLSDNEYRVGHHGKVDLRYTERETTGEFYIEHLPRLDGANVRPYVDAGDNVRLIDMDHAKLEELQLERCGWNEEIKDLMGKTGEVIMVDKDGDVKVKFGGSSYFINPLCLAMGEKKQAGNTASGLEVELNLEDTNVGELLAALLLKSELDKLKDRLGGSDDTSSGAVLFQAAASGNANKVREIIGDHPEAVKFQNAHQQSGLQAAAHRGHMEVVVALVRGKAPLEHADEDGDTALAFAVLGDKPEIVKYLLQAGSKINAADNKGLTPLHFAAAKGHQTCAEVLLKHDKEKCDVNYKDKDGDSPLFIAIDKNNKQITHWLVHSPRTDLRQTNNKGFNSLHHATFHQNTFAVEAILSASPNIINIAKNDGFTALHLAALNGLSDIAMILVKQVGCNKELKTNGGQTALHLAVNKTHNKCIEALVNNGANVNAQDGDGDTSLHLVMMEASMKDVLRVTPLGQLMQLAEQLQDGAGSSDTKSNLVAIAVYLIKKGANIYIKNKKGQNVLDVTLNPGVEKLLKDLYQQKRVERVMKNTAQSSCKVS